MGQHAPFGATGAPYGAQMPRLKTKPMGPPRLPPPYAPPNLLKRRAASFRARAPPGTPINISGGEFVIPPMR